jgi:type I restriction enzyme S subunit
MTTVPILNKGNFERVPVPLPPLPEQRAIAHVLRTVQRAKEATEAVIAATRELKQSLLRHLFTYGPVPVEQADQVVLKETEIGPVPDDWQTVLLGDVCHVSTGTTPSTAKPEYYDGTVPFIKTSEIANSVIEGARTRISDVALRDYRLKLYPKGTVFLAMYGQGKTRGQVALLNIEATTTQNTAALVCDSRLNPRFLWFYLMSQYQTLRGEGIQGHISHLNLGYVKRLVVPLPPTAIQAAIAKALTAVELKFQAESKRAQALDALFISLLDHLMTGKARVGDVMPALAAASVT